MSHGNHAATLGATTMANTYPTKEQTIKMTKEPKDAKGNALAMWEQCKEAFSGAKGGKLTVEEFCAKAAQGRRNLRRGWRLGYLVAA